MKLLTLSFCFRSLILFQLLLWHTAAVAEDLPDEFRVKTLSIEGTHHLKKKEIKSVLTISPPSFWRFWIKSPLACEDDISDDAERISQLYKSMGYYHVKVAYFVDVSESASNRTPSAHVSYTIDEGAPVIVEHIDIVSDGPTAPLPPGNTSGRRRLVRRFPFDSASRGSFGAKSIQSVRYHHAGKPHLRS